MNHDPARRFAVPFWVVTHSGHRSGCYAGPAGIFAELFKSWDPKSCSGLDEAQRNLMYGAVHSSPQREPAVCLDNLNSKETATGNGF